MGRDSDVSLRTPPAREIRCREGRRLRRVVDRLGLEWKKPDEPFTP